MKREPPVFTLVPDEVSNETVECLRTLLRYAERKEVIGISYTAMLRERHYIANTAGEAFRNPTFALGMTQALMWKLCGRLYGGNP